jgi:putative oxidoreductase
METGMQFLDKYAPYALAVLRVVTALLFIEHGTSKLFGVPAMPGAGSAGGSLPPLILVAALLEVFGGLAILVGFFTRPVAFILSGLMAVAYWMAHVPKGGFCAGAQIRAGQALAASDQHAGQATQHRGFGGGLAAECVWGGLSC